MDKPTNGYTQTAMYTDKADRQVLRRRERQTHGQTGEQMDKQIDRRTGRQRSTHRQTNEDRQRHM